MRVTGALAPSDVSSVAAICKIRDGHVIVEMRRTKEKAALADRLCGVLLVDLCDLTDLVASLWCSTEVEDVNLDPVATEDDVLTVVTAAASKTGEDGAGVGPLPLGSK